MRRLLEHGTPLNEIIHKWRWEYSEEEIKNFLQPKIKRTPRKKVANDLGNSDM
jgi:hypothetical protein